MLVCVSAVSIEASSRDRFSDRTPRARHGGRVLARSLSVDLTPCPPRVRPQFWLHGFDSLFRAAERSLTGGGVSLSAAADGLS